MAREQLGTTGIGYGVAIPHSRLPDLAAPIVALARHPQGVDFDAIDGEPVHLVVMLLVPDDAENKHLALLATLARLLQQASFRSFLMTCEDPQELSDAFAAEAIMS